VDFFLSGGALLVPSILLKTNALALAIGVIIGGAVGKVVASLVSDVLMPLISLAIPGGKWREAKIVLATDAEGVVTSAISSGQFFGSIIDFVIIAAIVFMVTKSLLKPAPAAPAPATKNCPYCTEAVPVAAKRCKFCTSAV
jgi:large conductance mechanosensitive channel